MKIQFILGFILLVECSSQQTLKIPLSLKIWQPKSFQDIDNQNYTDVFSLYVTNIQVGKEKKAFRVSISTIDYNGQLILPKNGTKYQMNGQESEITNGYICDQNEFETPSFGCNFMSYKGQCIQTSTQAYFGDFQFPEMKAFIIYYFQNILYKTDKFPQAEVDGALCLSNFDLEKILNPGQINPIKYSLYCGQESGEIILGGFNPEKIYNISEIYYHNFSNHNNLHGTNFAFSDFNYKKEYIEFSFDSQSQYIFLSKAIFLNFQSLLIQKYGASVDIKNNTLIPCDANLPDLQFTQLDSNGVNRIYTIPQSYYLQDIGQKLCSFLVKQIPFVNNIDQIYLGLPFFKRYVYILKGEQLGFSLSKNVIDSSNSVGWAIYLIIIGGFLLVGFISFMLHKYFKRKRQLNNNILTKSLSSEMNSSVNESLEQSQINEISLGNHGNVSQNLFQYNIQGQNIQIQDYDQNKIQNQIENKKQPKQNQKKDKYKLTF